MKNLYFSYAKKAYFLMCVAAVALIASEPAMAQAFNSNGKTIGAVASNITTSITGIGPLIMAICYVGALTFGLIGAMKWKAYGEQPDRTPLKIPLMFWGIAVLLAGFPEFMGTGITSLWGSGASLIAEPV